MIKFLNWLATGRRFFLIENFDGSPYLLRLLIRGYLPRDPKKPKEEKPKNYKFSVYLHRFMSKDQDRDLHNHPWKWSFAIILWGGYVEEKRKRNGKVIIRRVWPGMINILGPKDFHRILELKGQQTWSLFFAGGKASAWGFLVNGLFVRAKEYLAAKGYIDEPHGVEDLPEWLLTCACCAGRFPPPGNYYVRTEKNQSSRRGIRAPVCDTCASLPYPTNDQKEFHHA